MEAPETLVLWEAQYGDFANGAQVVIDQFVSSAEDKWQQVTRLGLLLPHGYEGQGPEHSSARIERYLQLCAEDNMQVCNVTTPGQYFHLLRRHMRQPHGKPLVLFTPKSLLRFPASFSSLEELASGRFQTVIDDGVADRAAISRVLLCSGKVFYDLTAAREEKKVSNVAIVRVEQLYPFPRGSAAAGARELPGGKGSRLGAGGVEEHGRVDLPFAVTAGGPPGGSCACATPAARRRPRSRPGTPACTSGSWRRCSRRPPTLTAALRETRVAVFSILMLLCSPVRGATFVVTSAADSGPGSLRQALLDAPGDLDGDFINFSIGSGVATIRPLSELPVLDFGLIDGTTQPGYVGSPLIEIDGSLLPALATGLRVSFVEIRALVVNRCSYRGISTTGNLTLTRSFIGTDVTGKIARGNGVGVYTTGSGPGIKIGGFNPLDGNVISGNSAYAIVMGPGGGTVRGNRIGTDVTGESPLPNGNGIRVQDSSDVIIGGCCSGESRNVISGNTQFGIELLRSSAVLISRNDIGPSASGEQLGSSQRAGIAVYESSDVAIGGESGQGAQIIAYNSDVGIGIDSGSRRIRIDQNSIFSNGFGIDLDFVLNTSNPRVTPTISWTPTSERTSSRISRLSIG